MKKFIVVVLFLGLSHSALLSALTGIKNGTSAWHKVHKGVKGFGLGPVQKITLDTSGSNLPVKYYSVCEFIPEHTAGSGLSRHTNIKFSPEIRCDGNVVFKAGEFEQHEGFAIGQPPHLAYPDTFIGSYIKSAGDKPGAGQRVFFLKKQVEDADAGVPMIPDEK